MLARIFYMTYFMILIYAVWFIRGEPESHAIINLIPLNTIHLYIAAFIHDFAPLHIIIGNLLGNIVLTIPIGILLFDHFRHMGILVILFFSIYIPVYIEVVQLLLHLAGYSTRSVDIDDVLLNMIGIWIGYLITNYICAHSLMKS